MFTYIARSVACGLVGLLFFANRADCQAQSGISYTKAEQLVLRRVADGKVAKFGDVAAKKRTVSADFLARLLTGKLTGVSVSSEGVLIEHAVVHGRLGVAGAEIRYTVLLNDCDFEGGADFSRSHLQGDYLRQIADSMAKRTLMACAQTATSSFRTLPLTAYSILVVPKSVEA